MVDMKPDRKILSIAVVLASFICVMCSCDNGSSTLPPPSTGPVRPGETDMSSVYDYVQSYQLSYIRSLQLPSGAIKDNSGQTSKITPYFAHFAVLALLTDPSDENLMAAENYMKWYFSKLNGEVTDFRDDEIPGSVYDYFAPDETTQGNYDSVDSYAATFLEIAMRYASISAENIQWLKQYKSQVSLVASAMMKTIDMPGNSLPGGSQNDWLSIAHYRYIIKYLMDNSEVNMGIKAAIWLKQNGLLDTDVDLDALLENNTAAVRSLYNEANQNYDYAKGNESDWNVFYPGATAQLYPCLFGVTSPLESRSRQMYEKFNSFYPEWSSGKTYDTYPWTMIVYAAAVMNDKERTDAYIMHIYGMNVRDEQKAYWYDAEAGSLVLAIDTIRNNNAHI